MDMVVDNEKSMAPVNLLQLAIEKGASVEQLGQLMDLAERQDKEQARKSFFAARAKFQSLCPVITKDVKVSYGQTNYKFASLGAIAGAIRGPMEECSLSYRFEFDEPLAGLLRVNCVISHSAGHSESNPMTAEPDSSGAKNKIQQQGSTATYLQRYTLIGALGITTAQDDDDGRSSGQDVYARAVRCSHSARDNFWSIAAIKEAIGNNNLELAIEARDELDDEAVNDLNLAPTKGGIFTTEELRAMKSDEWSRLRREINGTTIKE
jgi:hypothetical protein